MENFNEKYYNYIHSQKWNFKRRQVAEKNNYRCQICNVQIFKGFHIHHLTYKNFGNENLEDLMFLCPECHLMKIHKQKNKKLTIQKNQKIKKLTKQEKDLYANKEYFLENFNKLNTQNKSSVTLYLRQNYKSFFREITQFRAKQKEYFS